VWPEDVIALARPLAGSPEATTVAALARRLDATVLAGVTITEADDTFRNEIVAWSPGGRIVSVFEKVHRVPFGEYVPFRGFFSHLADLAAVPRDAIAGHGSGLMRTPAGPLGVLVSYEVFFAARGRSSVRAGAEMLVVPTNTSSYANAQMPSQEVAADRVQAVEEGRDLVQAAPTGYSTFVTNRGVVRQRSGLSDRQVLVAPVPLRRGATLYERFGDLPTLVLSALALAAGLAAGILGRRRAGQGPPVVEHRRAVDGRLRRRDPTGE
jgi:apolipoprotein N-acyltransferase